MGYDHLIANVEVTIGTDTSNLDSFIYCSTTPEWTYNATATDRGLWVNRTCSGDGATGTVIKLK